MNKRKLVSILAITGVVANLGLATAFADDTTGTEVIGCYTGVDAAIAIQSATASIAFADRDTVFTLGNAPIDGDPLEVVVKDNRGYNPDTNPDGPASNRECGPGKFLQIQSGGLEGPLATTLPLDLTDSLVAGDITCVSGEVCVPSTVSAVAVPTGVNSVGNLEVAQNLVRFTEAFQGKIQTTMHDSELEVLPPVSGDPVPTGTYTGLITFTLADL